MLKVDHVTKKYGKLVAVNDVSFAIGGGEIAVLLGPNGAGKSTVIKCITGLLRFDGEILIDGEKNKSLEAKRRLGYVPEMPAVYDMLTVGEHLDFMLRAYKMDDDGTAQQLLQRFELLDKKDKLGKELSKGMQQKLSICCALVHRPTVVIFDEPMVGLDPHAIKQLKDMFRELKAAGATVLISTHMLDSVEDYWDRAYIMKDGAFCAEKAADDTDGQSLEDLFFALTEGGADAAEGGDPS
ncbi:MAG: ABC transporter ATP-binding protein [Clostridia bacterium]|nr:ABC transporter ATP-binding protein [Clostridia bacterium]MBR3551987.1 ABC transporter ATP-binding protein [Clostridia bacterium]